MKKNLKLNQNLIKKYFNEFKDKKIKIYQFERIFHKFFNFCFELSLDNMIKESKNFKN